PCGESSRSRKMQRIALFVAITTAVLTTGCSKSSDSPPPQAAAPQPVPPPDVAVREFLEAIRTGDDKKAEQMLTDLARQKTAQAEMQRRMNQATTPSAANSAVGMGQIQTAGATSTPGAMPANQQASGAPATGATSISQNPPSFGSTTAGPSSPSQPGANGQAS